MRQPAQLDVLTAVLIAFVITFLFCPRLLEKLMSSCEEKSAAARRQLVEAEASVLHALAAARTALAAIDEENHELRRNELKRRTEFYTEAEFAALLKVSESTISRLRKRNQIQPLMVGGQIRYSSLHVEHADEIFAKASPTAARRRSAHHGLREVG